MGKKRTGYIRTRTDAHGVDRYSVEVAGAHVPGSSTADPERAQRTLNAVLQDQAGTAPDTLGVFAVTFWFKREQSALKRKRYTAFKTEDSRWRTHVETAPFYNWPLRKLTPHVIQTWVNELQDKFAVRAVRKLGGETVLIVTKRRLSRRTCAATLNLLELCLDAAIIAGKISGTVADGKISGNPARIVKLEREEPRELDGELIVHLSTAEIAAVLSLDLPPFQRAVFTVAIFTGLRLDELWGLRWQDVSLDLRRPQVQVRRSYGGAVKTKTSIRDVPLLPPAAEALRAWQASQSPRPIGGLVFPGRDGKPHGPSYHAQWRDKSYRKSATGDLKTQPGWRTKAGIRPNISFLSMRHTCGCHLVQGTWLARPMTLHQVKTWLGHSTIAVTERHYAYLTSDNLHSAVEGSAYNGFITDRKTDHTSKVVIKSGV